ncbi:hypothetical protein IQ06DRAFT_290049 [Phaeosphaeriaceae sp. SRC1lsM3a]|nr:hypothetical protein IQ06DRAFT_290049 [Stagonospora sp. SRC1lsM3a]
MVGRLISTSEPRALCLLHCVLERRSYLLHAMHKVTSNSHRSLLRGNGNNRSSLEPTRHASSPTFTLISRSTGHTTNVQIGCRSSNRQKVDPELPRLTYL